MQARKPTPQQIRRAKISFALAGIMVGCVIYFSRGGPDPEAIFLLPVFASPAIAAAIGYGIGNLNGYFGESIGLCLFMAIFVDVYLIVQLF